MLCLSMSMPIMPALLLRGVDQWKQRLRVLDVHQRGLLLLQRQRGRRRRRHGLCQCVKGRWLALEAAMQQSGAAWWAVTRPPHKGNSACWRGRLLQHTGVFRRQRSIGSKPRCMLRRCGVLRLRLQVLLLLPRQRRTTIRPRHRHRTRAMCRLPIGTCKGVHGSGLGM